MLSCAQCNNIKRHENAEMLGNVFSSIYPDNLVDSSGNVLDKDSVSQLNVTDFASHN